MQPSSESIPLRDIHLPQAISWWPPAIGWWLIIVAVIAVCVVLWLLRKARQKRRLRKNMQASLQTIKHNYYRDNNSVAAIEAISVLLRRIGMTYYQRKQVASLTGPEWIQFLNAIFAKSKQYKAFAFTQEMGVAISSLHYRKIPEPLTESFIEEIIKTTSALIDALPLQPQKNAQQQSTQQLISAIQIEAKDAQP